MERFLLGSNRVELDTHAVHGAAGTTPLSPIETELLRRLVEAKGQAVSVPTLLRDVWGYSEKSKTRTVTSTLNRLRKKVEPTPSAPAFLVTHRGEGIALVGAEPVAAVAELAGPALIGRESAVQACLDGLRGGRGVTLTGAIGSGKTSVAKRVAEAWDGSVVWVEVGSVRSALELYSLLVAQAPIGLPPTLDAVARMLEPLSNPLIVLDAVQTAEVYGWVEGLAVLATGLPARHGSRSVVRLGPLDVDDALAVLTAAVQRSGFHVEPHHLVSAVEQSDRLPLQLELMAPVLGLFGPAGGLPAEPRIDASVDRALSHLDERRRSLVRVLAVFSDGFGPVAVAAVAERPVVEIMADLRLLVDRGLITADGMGSFRLLRVLRGVEVDANTEHLLLRYLVSLEHSSLMDGGVTVERHQLDLMRAVDWVTTGEEALAIGFGMIDVAQIFGGGAQALPLVRSLFRRFPHDDLEFMVCLLGVAVERSLPSDVLTTVRARAEDGDLRFVWVMALHATRLGRTDFEGWLNAGLDASARPEVEARLLPALLANLGGVDLHPREAAIRRSLARRGWRAATTMLDVARLHTYALRGDAGMVLSTDLQVDMLSPPMRSHVLLDRGVALFLQGRLEDAGKVVSRAAEASSRYLVGVSLMRCLIEVARGVELTPLPADVMHFMTAKHLDMARGLVALGNGAQPLVTHPEVVAAFDGTLEVGSQNNFPPLLALSVWRRSTTD